MALTPEQEALDYNPELQDVSRQRKLADLLLAKGFDQPQGQMISGRYVAPSFTQQLNPLANVLAGQAIGSRADTEQAKIAETLRTVGQQEVQGILQAAQTDPKAALALASSAKTPQGRALAQSLMQSVLPKKTDKLVEYDTYKAEGGKKAFNDWAKEITPEQQAKLDIDRQRLGLEGSRFGLDQQRFGLEQQKAAQELMFGKPLPEGALKQVTGATNLKDAIDNYKTKLKDFSTLDIANPNARASMGNAYNNMMLQAKEAYNLGVLNGPDYAILQSVVKDPTNPSSLLVSKKTLEQQANDLSKQADIIVGNVYKTHNRPVPTGLGAQQQMLQTPQGQQAPKKVVNFNDLP